MEPLHRAVVMATELSLIKLSQSANNWTEAVLHSFDGAHGGAPSAGLILGPRGVIYGTAGFGGMGQGVVFSITP
jgi:hypothetical protein